MVVRLALVSSGLSIVSCLWMTSRDVVIKGQRRDCVMKRNRVSLVTAMVVEPFDAAIQIHQSCKPIHKKKLSFLMCVLAFIKKPCPQYLEEMFHLINRF